MTEQTVTSINASTNPRSLNGIVHMGTVQPGDDLPQLNLSPPYQRSSVWTLEQRRRMIKSILRGIQLPSVYLNAPEGRRSVQFNVVDGKQRIETLLAFVLGEFSIPSAWIKNTNGGRAMVRLPETWTDPEIRFTDLDPSERSSFLLSNTIGVIETELPTVEAEAEMYLDLNEAGTTQTSEDLNRARQIASGAPVSEEASDGPQVHFVEWHGNYRDDGKYTVLAALDQRTAQDAMKVLEDAAKDDDECEGFYMVTSTRLIVDAEDARDCVP